MASQKSSYNIVNYSFVVNNKVFIDKLKSELSELPEFYSIKNDKLYVNLRTVQDRTDFFGKLKEFNKNNENKVMAKELVYKFFVRNSKEELKFSDLINKIKKLLSEDEKTKNLVNSFKIYNLGRNYKVLVTSYDVTMLLNGTEMFYPYKSKQERTINVSTVATKEVSELNV